MTPTLTGLILIGVIVIITLYYAWLDHHYVFYDENGRQCRLLNTPEDVYKALTLYAERKKHRIFILNLTLSLIIMIQMSYIANNL